MVILNKYNNIGGFCVKPNTSTAASYLWRDYVQDTRQIILMMMIDNNY